MSQLNNTIKIISNELDQAPKIGATYAKRLEEIGLKEAIIEAFDDFDYEEEVKIGKAIGLIKVYIPEYLSIFKNYLGQKLGVDGYMYGVFGKTNTTNRTIELLYQLSLADVQEIYRQIENKKKADAESKIDTSNDEIEKENEKRERIRNWKPQDGKKVPTNNTIDYHSPFYPRVYGSSTGKRKNLDQIDGTWTD